MNNVTGNSSSVCIIQSGRMKRKWWQSTRMVITVRRNNTMEGKHHIKQLRNYASQAVAGGKEGGARYGPFSRAIKFLFTCIHKSCLLFLVRQLVDQFVSQSVGQSCGCSFANYMWYNVLLQHETLLCPVTSVFKVKKKNRFRNFITTSLWNIVLY